MTQPPARPAGEPVGSRFHGDSRSNCRDGTEEEPHANEHPGSAERKQRENKRFFILSLFIQVFQVFGRLPIEERSNDKG
jgi:hypothetical protein